LLVVQLQCSAIEDVEENVGTEHYLGYACFVGQTKYGSGKFAAEIQVSGVPKGGVLTLSVYSADERILSGFFVDVMIDVRQNVEILEETSKTKPTICSNCGASIDFTAIEKSRIYLCSSCGFSGKIAPWVADDFSFGGL
jgi:predicted RNA-binding Zn-ribbon protein involved in translation (DUF1610 family)